MLLDNRPHLPPGSLAVIHASVGRRCGLPIDMIGTPMHFLTRVGASDSPHETFVDVYNCGKLLRREEVLRLVR